MFRRISPKLNAFSLITLFVLLFMCSSAGAQTYVPLGPTNPPAEDHPVTLTIGDLKSKLLMNGVLAAEIASLKSTNNNLLPEPATLPACANVPTVDQIAGNLEYHQSYLSTSAALKLGIPIALNVSGSGSQTVLVRDFSRGIQCAATDGATTLFYGQTIRTIVTMASVEGKGDVTLPFIAASASLNNKSNQVSVVVYGFANPKIDAVIANIAGKELNVETYGDFVKVEKDLITLVGDPTTIKSVARLGAISNALPVNLSENVIVAYALAQIVDRQSCDEAKNSFRSRDNPSAMALDETYKKVVGACNANKPTEIQKLQAKEFLLNLKVKY